MFDMDRGEAKSKGGLARFVKRKEPADGARRRRDAARKWCPHCFQRVSARTYFRHRSQFFDSVSRTWKCANEAPTTTSQDDSSDSGEYPKKTVKARVSIGIHLLAKACFVFVSQFVCLMIFPTRLWSGYAQGNIGRFSNCARHSTSE